MSKNTLIGKEIERLEIATDKMAMKFVISGEEDIVVKTDGDCCSHTWIEHVSLPAYGFPATVTGAENLQMPDPESISTDGDEIAYYGFKIMTNKGDIIIDYRNASNGYYGGGLVWPDEGFYGGVYGQNISNEEWIPLDKDI